MAAWKFLQAIQQRDMNDDRVGAACVPFVVYKANGLHSRSFD
jgi:hypothetical protein